MARNLLIAGFIERILGARHPLAPTAWVAAERSADVTQDAYERTAAMSVDGSRDARADAV